jgi:hypothetical protein
MSSMLKVSLKKRLNNTFIALLPKKAGVVDNKDIHPISQSIGWCL